jgi:hypothetical protein
VALSFARVRYRFLQRTLQGHATICLIHHFSLMTFSHFRDFVSFFLSFFIIQILSILSLLLVDRGQERDSACPSLA